MGETLRDLRAFFKEFVPFLIAVVLTILAVWWLILRFGGDH
jgi:hypothetical protein